MSVNGGNGDCTTGMSARVYEAMLSDMRSGFSMSMSNAQVGMVKAQAASIGSGVAAEINSGEVYARYRVGGAQTFAPGGPWPMAFSSVVEDTRAACTVYPYWRFTCPVGGLYLVSSSTILVSPGGGGMFLDVVVNGTTEYRHAYPVNTTYPYMSPQASVLVRLSISDVVSIALSNGTGANVSNSTSPWDSWVAVARVGV